MGCESVDAFGQHVQLQQCLEIRRSSILEKVQVVEVAMEGTLMSFPGSHHSSVHSLDGEYTRCPLKSYET